MRRLALLTLAALAVAVPAAPGQAGTGHCVSSGGVTACPQLVMRCTPGDVIEVRVVGAGGFGTAACGDASASCGVLRATCRVQDRTTTSGILTCSTTGGTVVAYCSIVTQAN